MVPHDSVADSVYHSTLPTLPLEGLVCSFYTQQQQHTDVLCFSDLTVILDTGSFDLLVDTGGLPPHLTNTTDIQASEEFGSGSALGNVDFAELQLGDFTIHSQGTLLYMPHAASCPLIMQRECSVSQR